MSYWICLHKINVPEANNKTIKNIESITDILNKTIGGKLEKHFNCENGAEDHIADFNHLVEQIWSAISEHLYFCQGLRLVVVLYAHAECVNENTEQDSLKFYSILVI